MRALLLLLAIALANAETFTQVWENEVGAKIIPKDSGLTMHQMGEHLISSVGEFGLRWLAQNGVKPMTPPTKENPGDNPYPYFGFIPFFLGNLIPDGKPVQWASPCFRSFYATAKTQTNGSIVVTVDVGPSQGNCRGDFYIFSDLESMWAPEFLVPGVHTYLWENGPDISSAEMWDLYNRSTGGIRILRFVGNREAMAVDLVETVGMFEAFFQPSVSDACAQRNLYFMDVYANVQMQNRTTDVVSLSEDDIHDGDFFGVVRLDGVDTMLAWAMGSTTGHTTIALRIDGALHICESTTLDAYWPVNGIQCTPWQTWQQQCQQANMNIVHAPLNDYYRGKFNSSAAYDFFLSQQGFDYGWYNLLFGWVDTEQDNYPCVPPYPSNQCLTWDIIEVLFALFEKVSPDFYNKIAGQALNNRLGTSGLSEAETFQTATQMGIPVISLPTIVESDTFRYNTTRDDVPAQGLSMVCCVFVCNMWKHGGVFDDINQELNCAEMTNWDDYALTLFDLTTPRPPQCVSADPSNQCCQIMGKYTLNLNNYDSKDPYPHMAENCPSEAPDYVKPANC